MGHGVVVSSNTASQEAGGVGWFSACMSQGELRLSQLGACCVCC